MHWWMLFEGYGFDLQWVHLYCGPILEACGPDAGGATLIVTYHWSPLSNVSCRLVCNFGMLPKSWLWKVAADPILIVFFFLHAIINGECLLVVHVHFFEDDISLKKAKTLPLLSNFSSVFVHVTSVLQLTVKLAPFKAFCQNQTISCTASLKRILHSYLHTS